MPRKHRLESSDGLYHVINRENDRSWSLEYDGAKPRSRSVSQPSNSANDNALGSPPWHAVLSSAKEGGMQIHGINNLIRQNPALALPANRIGTIEFPINNIDY